MKTEEEKLLGWIKHMYVGRGSGSRDGGYISKEDYVELLYLVKERSALKKWYEDMKEAVEQEQIGRMKKLAECDPIASVHVPVYKKDENLVVSAPSKKHRELHNQCGKVVEQRDTMVTLEFLGYFRETLHVDEISRL